MNGTKLGSMPRPSSRTTMRASPEHPRWLPGDARSSSTDKATCPPAGVNLIAFDSRFQITCCSRDGSPRNPAGRVGIDVSIWIPLASALGRTASTAARAIVPISIGCVSSRSLPVMMRETSRMSSISTACALALRSMVSSALRDFSAERFPERNIPVQPTIAASGVRSSCDRVARNSSLARLAASASSRACRSRSTTRSYSSSARF